MIEILLVLFVLVIAVAGQRSLTSRIERLEDEIRSLKLSLQSMAAGTVLPQPEQVEEAGAVEEAEAEPAGLETAPAETLVPAAAMEQPPEAADVAEAPWMAAPVQAAAPASRIETSIGSRWAVWVGGVALALGGVLMVRYSIENGLISPAVRLLAAALFGLAMIVAGEAVRRRGVPSGMKQLSDRIGPNAMVPGILTAAGGVSLFASIFAAHQLYGFIGAGLAFTAMAAVALAILVLSLFHGQALAGLGMLGGLIAPALVEHRENPSIPLLMAYVVLIWFGTLAASRLRGWNLVPFLASLGAGIWAALAAETAAVSPVVAFIAMLAGAVAFTPDVPEFGTATESERAAARLGNWSLWLALTVTSLSAAMMLGNAPELLAGHRLPFEAMILLLALGAALALRRDALPSVTFFGLGACAVAANAMAVYAQMEPDTFGGPTLYRTMTAVAGGVVLLLAAILALRTERHRARPAELIWTAIAGLPLPLLAFSYADHGNWIRDPVHAIFSGLLALVLLALTDALLRKRPIGLSLAAEGGLVTFAFLSAAFALFAVLDGLALELGLSLLGLAFFLGHRLRPWPSLPFMMVAGTALVAARIAWDPTVVGQDNLGTTPVFNALLPAYGIPALLLVLTARLARRLESALLVRLLDAAAALMSFLAIAVLVRHGLNGGVLHGATPNLGETSIYTLLLIGFSGALLQIDRRDGNPAFVYGSMIAGGLSMVSVLGLHLFARNPYVTGELVGDWPLLNLLLPGYLLPALAYGGLSLMARTRRPYPYVVAIAISGALMGFAWVTLSVRQAWQGTSLADWQGFLEGETYTYSVVWLLTGVVLLVLGTRFRSPSLRYASAAVVIVTVLKVFLIDLSNLEGLLRAFSFIGLGLALIGIGLFYQRLLLKSAEAEGADATAGSSS
ncbi:DUF2339 domain-containing protein [Gellertiella hungarica]|uniref:Putative membrane protein n=1 Tax=Gellertiella hungarica TaxID=1572859 RepID=A0A7W6J6B6_9HYPH|nr:DUF2339 domain-containing protein [Gellertiella hungarica]MBB4065596.1 putative membrane protein [Gellertiella hungarica]